MSNPAFAFDHIHIISQSPQDAANWYVQMFGADIVADTVARGAPQIFLGLGGKTLMIRGQRPGEAPTAAREIQPYADYSSHNTWGTDHFGFLYHGDLRAFCDELRAKGVRFPVPLKEGVGGRCVMSQPPTASVSNWCKAESPACCETKIRLCAWGEACMMVDISQRDLGTMVRGQDIRTTVASIDRECLVGVSPLLALFPHAVPFCERAWGISLNFKIISTPISPSGAARRVHTERVAHAVSAAACVLS